MTRTEEFARVFFTAHYEAAHGEGGELAWARLSDGERTLWLEGGEAVDKRTGGSGPDASTPPSEEAPVYAKSPQDGSMSSLWMITVDEGWRKSVLCSGMYERDADFLLSVLGRTPRGAR